MSATRTPARVSPPSSRLRSSTPRSMARNVSMLSSTPLTELTSSATASDVVAAPAGSSERLSRKRFGFTGSFVEAPGKSPVAPALRRRHRRPRLRQGRRLILRVRVLAAEVVALAPDARARNRSPRRLRRGGCVVLHLQAIAHRAHGVVVLVRRRRGLRRVLHRRRRATQGRKREVPGARTAVFEVTGGGRETTAAIERIGPGLGPGLGPVRALEERPTRNALRLGRLGARLRLGGGGARRRRLRLALVLFLEVLGDLEQRVVDADARLLLSVNARRR